MIPIPILKPKFQFNLTTKTMKLQTLELSNFKNYETAFLQFQGKFTCFTGNNGQGKTNLLDAIYYLSLTKSFLNPVDTTNIKHNQDFFRIAGQFSKDDGTFHKVVCLQEKNERKKITVNDKNIDRFADHIGEFPLVIISPADFDIIWSGEERRRFIDSTISQFDRPYLDQLQLYNRTLAQRNKLLKQIQGVKNPEDYLLPFDMKLNEFASYLHEQRKEFLVDFIPYVRDAYAKIVLHLEDITLEFDSELLEKPLFGLLEKYRSRDLAMGHTGSGIHREDIAFFINGFPLKKFGSQGQQKSFLIALKLAKHKYISIKKKNIPLLLVDDLHDKLDAQRVQHLFAILSESDFDQVFISDTQRERLTPLISAIKTDVNFFHIENGTVTEAEHE